MGRIFKWVWVPLVSLILGVMQPLTSYYMPQILDYASGLPEGAVIQIPQPSAAEGMSQVLSQFGTIGVLILVLSFMGAVAGERHSGTIILIYGQACFARCICDGQMGRNGNPNARSLFRAYG